MEYKLPPIKKAEEGKQAEAVNTHCEEEEYPSEWDRRIRIPVNQDIARALEVGARARVVLSGNVDGLQSRKDGRNELTIYLDSVSTDDSVAEEDLEEGFNNSGFGSKPSF